MPVYFLQKQVGRPLPHGRETAVDRDGSAGVELGSRRGEKDSDAGKVFGHAPAAGGSAGQYPFVQPFYLPARVAHQGKTYRVLLEEVKP